MVSRKPRGMLMAKGLAGVRDARVLPLRQLRPPGALYRSWYFLPAGMNPDMPESWGLFGLEGTERPAAVLRLHELAPFYAGEIPQAALNLDRYVSTSMLPVRRAGDRVVDTPLKNFVASVESRVTKQEPSPSREMVHRLHAKGLFLLGDDAVARISVARPRMPWEAWRFRDGEEVGSRQVTRPGHTVGTPYAGRLGKLGIPATLPVGLRALLVSLGEEYREAFGRSEDPAIVIARDIRKAEALAQWAADPSATEKVKSAALRAEELAEIGRRRLLKIQARSTDGKSARRPEPFTSA